MISAAGPATTVIHTIGHSGHALELFVDLLRQHGIAALVDVRSHPTSRRAPQFQKEPFARFLAAAGLEYVYLGRELGGRPTGAEYYAADGQVDYARRAEALDFRLGVDQLVQLAGQRSVAIMCAEEDPLRCHRRRLVAPALEQHGVAVLHIRGDGRLQSEEELREPESQLRLFE
jgi:uncharacterized protein (DUF488 family)